jgi:pimeloyl-ACP methyl ester carboxylesterase
MSKPTIVLVHGAFADASSWAPVTLRLLDEGYTVLAPPVFNRSLVADAAYIKDFVEQIEGPVLLAGHSYGGAVITVAGVAENVVGLVYVSGYALDEGETSPRCGSTSQCAISRSAPPCFRQRPIPASRVRRHFAVRSPSDSASRRRNTSSGSGRRSARLPRRPNPHDCSRAGRLLPRARRQSSRAVAMASARRMPSEPPTIA